MGAHPVDGRIPVEGQYPESRLKGNFALSRTRPQFERERIVERTKEGLEAARKRGRVGGRPPALSPAQKVEVRRMRDVEMRPLPEIAALFKVSEKTIRRVV
jgi:DNA invertase Pin-like site-specific DNA recombinase